MNVLIQISNSDDKLTQRRWSEFIGDIRLLLDGYVKYEYIKIHGEWFSAPDSPWQNANWCIEIDNPVRTALRSDLATIRSRYNQDSIAWTQGEVEFI